MNIPFNKPDPFGTNRDYIFIAALLFFAVICILFTLPVSEGDFFWHVKSGQWIWEHKCLPTVDYFSNTGSFINPTEHVVERTRFILKQYWLGQLALFGIWKAAGEAGMVVLRTVLYTGILGFIYWWLSRSKKSIIPLATVFVVGNVLRNFPGERPQIFAFIGFVFLLYLLEKMTSRTDFRKKHALLLFFVMLVWSNCHASFILGIVIIALHATCHILLFLCRKGELDRSYLALLAGGILISFINPNGFLAFNSMMAANSNYLESTAEYLSPVTELLAQHVLDYYYWALLLVVIGTVAARFRSMALRHIVVLISLAALSLTALRYIPFFVLAVPLAVIYLPDWKPGTRSGLLPVLVVLLWLGSTDFKNVLEFRANRAFPVEAVRFLNTAKPSGNIFNYVYWGGYLMCYTDYPVFADGRGLDEKFTIIHSQVLAGMDWQSTLAFFNINTIIIPGTSEGTGATYPLLLPLYKDDAWSLIYQDDVALVLMRNLPQNREFLERHAISKERIPMHITSRLAWQLKNKM